MMANTLLSAADHAGDAAAFDTATLRPLRQSADAHMVFVTAVGFDSQESCLLSASADASAWLTSTQPQGGVRVSYNSRTAHPIAPFVTLLHGSSVFHRL